VAPSWSTVLLVRYRDSARGSGDAVLSGDQVFSGGAVLSGNGVFVFLRR
jgi:hypothetical protein